MNKFTQTNTSIGKIQKIGIVVAMKEEISPFLQHYTTQQIAVGNYTVYKIQIADKQIFAVRQFNAGEIFASSATQMLISVFGVDMILNFGVVGSLCENISLHSTVFVDSVVHYAMDTSCIDNYPIGRYSCFDSNVVQTSAELIQKALQILPNTPVVRCASADKFVDSVEEKRQLAKQFDASICDMESAGILFVAKQNNIPVLFVKTVSDSLMGGANEFEKNLAISAEKHVHFVQKFLELL